MVKKENLHKKCGDWIQQSCEAHLGVGEPVGGGLGIKGTPAGGYHHEKEVDTKV